MIRSNFLQQRNIGLVFQDYALFPNMSVRENLIYALKGTSDKAWLDELIDLVELGNSGPLSIMTSYLM